MQKIFYRKTYQKPGKQTFFDFPKKNKISFIRFACHKEEITEIIPYCNKLKKKGFIIGINLMQISEINNIEIEKFLCKFLNLKQMYFTLLIV